jgi:DNA-binding transcriptional LysR family regulator
MIVSNAPNMKSAAVRLGVSAAAISQAISRLERDFGVALLERSSHGIRLTPAGATLRQHASILLGAGEEMLEALDGYRNLALPRLRIYIRETVAKVLLPTLITSFSDLVGDLSVQSAPRSDYVEEFLRGMWDILISTDDLSDIPHVESQPLFRERLIAIVPAEIYQSTQDIAEIAQRLTFLSNGLPAQLQTLTKQFFDENDIDIVRSTDCLSTGATLDLVAQGFGWAVITPLSLARLYFDGEKIAWVTLPAAYSRELYLSNEKNRLMDVPNDLARECRRAFTAEIATWHRRLPPQAVDAVEVLGA